MIIAINSRFLTQKITGVQRYAIEISRRLKNLCSGVEFLAPRNIIHHQLANSLDIHTFGKFTGHLWEQFELPQYLRKKGEPLLLNLANTAPLSYRNQIVTIHDLAFMENPKWFSKQFYHYYKFLIPRIMKNSVKIVTVSNFSQREIMRYSGISKDKIKVIYGAVIEDFRIDAQKKCENKYGKYILTVSSLDPRKNLTNLITSFHKLNLDSMRLVIVGTNNKVFAGKELKRIFNTNKNIQFAGHVSDETLLCLYKNAKLFVYPSLYEGFGLPPLEAMACGCPVVVSNVASLPEICGDAGFYVDPYDLSSIAEGIEKGATDEELRESLIHKGLQRARIFSWEKSANEHAEVLKEVLIHED